MLGSKRVDETAEFFRSLMPQRSKHFDNLYNKAWKPEDYPVVPQDQMQQAKKEEEKS